MDFVLVTIIATTHLSGYFLYFSEIRKNHIKPNAASWSVWAFSAVLESLSYIYLTNDLAKNILPTICALSAILLFIYCARFGHFGRLSSFEKKIVFIDVAILILWYLTQSVFFANVLFVLSAVISFVPLIKNVFLDPLVEKATPWFLWSSAYLFQIVLVFVNFESEDELLYPVVFLILHLIVALFALDIWPIKKRIKSQLGAGKHL